MSMVNTAIAAIVASLTAAVPVTANVTRVRRRELAADNPQAIVVRAEATEVAQRPEISGLPVTWTTVVSVECYQRAYDNVDTVLDALVDATYTRLMTDPTLGGAVVQLVPQGISYDFDSDGDQTACATLVFNVRHRTSGATLA